jgi:DNA-binding NarL/FixJ family response regulator
VAWEQPLDVALVDIALPGLDALRTVRKLRDRHPAARILVVAGVDAPYLRAAVAEAGANGYVNRGVDTERLADILASPHPEDGAGAER